MPKRWCQCRGCPACASPDRKPGSHGLLFDMDTTRTTKCPPCQEHATAARNARPSSSKRGLGWDFSRRKQADQSYQQAESCHWCGGLFTAADPKTADHLTPRSQGGADGPIVAAHRSCNSSRGGKLGHL